MYTWTESQQMSEFYLDSKSILSSTSGERLIVVAIDSLTTVRIYIAAAAHAVDM